MHDVIGCDREDRSIGAKRSITYGLWSEDIRFGATLQCPREVSPVRVLNGADEACLPRHLNSKHQTSNRYLPKFDKVEAGGR